jgi:hypothetical protein
MADAVVTLEDRRAVYALLDRYLDWLPPARLSVRRAETTVKVGVGRWRRCDTCDSTRGRRSVRAGSRMRSGRPGMGADHARRAATPGMCDCTGNWRRPASIR